MLANICFISLDLLEFVYIFTYLYTLRYSEAFTLLQCNFLCSLFCTVLYNFKVHFSCQHASVFLSRILIQLDNFMSVDIIPSPLLSSSAYFWMYISFYIFFLNFILPLFCCWHLFIYLKILGSIFPRVRRGVAENVNLCCLSCSPNSLFFFVIVV